MVKQKDVFLDGEADAWFARNSAALAARTDRIRQGGSDMVADALATICAQVPLPPDATILEVGCGDAGRLALMQSLYGVRTIGVEPSARAVAAAVANGVEAVQGTADRLPFESCSVDVLIYGFCLYLCDRDDLFNVIAEGHRVLKPQGWVVIEDFWAERPTSNPYHHRAGVKTHKMDYRRLFDWHPHYTCYRHQVYHHVGQSFTDHPDDWVACSILRRCDPVD